MHRERAALFSGFAAEKTSHTAFDAPMGAIKSSLGKGYFLTNASKTTCNLGQFLLK